MAIDLTGRRLLFADEFDLASVAGCEFQLMHPDVRNVAIRFNRPWEGDNSAYATVMPDPVNGGYKLIYRASKEGYGDNAHRICLATSTNGKNFTRAIQSPQFEQWDGEDTNIVFKSPFEGINAMAYSTFQPFLDTRPGVAASERYKVTARRGTVFGLTSPDLIDYTLVVGTETDPNLPGKTPIMQQSQATAAGLGTVGFADGPISVLWDDVAELYRAWIRIRETDANSLRTTCTATAAEFAGPWSGFQFITFKDGDGVAFPREPFYTHPVIRCPTDPTLLIALPARFEDSRLSLDLPGARITGMQDVCYMSSRDGIAWERRFPDPWLSHANDRLDWAGHGHNASPNLIETADGEWSFYVLHRYRQPQIHLQRYSVRIDGFVALFAPWNATATPGEVVTVPLTFNAAAERRLYLNFETNASFGYVKLELQDSLGDPITGFALADSPTLYGSEVSKLVTWAGGSDLSGLAQPIQVRLTPYMARIYSLRVS